MVVVFIFDSGPFGFFPAEVTTTARRRPEEDTAVSLWRDEISLGNEVGWWFVGDNAKDCW